VGDLPLARGFGQVHGIGKDRVRNSVDVGRAGRRDGWRSRSWSNEYLPMSIVGDGRGAMKGGLPNLA